MRTRCSPDFKQSLITKGTTFVSTWLSAFKSMIDFHLLFSNMYVSIHLILFMQSLIPSCIHYAVFHPFLPVFLQLPPLPSLPDEALFCLLQAGSLMRTSPQ